MGVVACNSVAHVHLNCWSAGIMFSAYVMDTCKQHIESQTNSTRSFRSWSFSSFYNLDTRSHFFQKSIKVQGGVFEPGLTLGSNPSPSDLLDCSRVILHVARVNLGGDLHDIICFLMRQLRSNC